MFLEYKKRIKNEIIKNLPRYHRKVYTHAIRHIANAPSNPIVLNCLASGSLSSTSTASRNRASARSESSFFVASIPIANAALRCFFVARPTSQDGGKVRPSGKPEWGEVGGGGG